MMCVLLYIGWYLLPVPSSSAAYNSTQTTDHWNSVKWALICCTIGIDIGVLITVAFQWIYRYYKSRQSTNPDTEARGGQQEPLILRTLKKPSEDCAGIETEDGGTRVESQIARDRLNKVKTQLEEKKADLDKQLQDVDNKREETKKELQLVEEKMTDKETVDKDTFIKKKETLLQSQWKLNEEKKNYETQRLDIERFLETLEI